MATPRGERGGQAADGFSEVRQPLQMPSRQYGAPFSVSRRAAGSARTAGMSEEAPRRRAAEGELTFNKLLSQGVCKGKNLRGESDEAFVAKQTHLSLNGSVPIKEPFCYCTARARAHTRATCRPGASREPWCHSRLDATDVAPLWWQAASYARSAPR